MKLRIYFTAVAFASNLYAGTMGPVDDLSFAGFYAGLGVGQTTIFSKDDFTVTVPGVGVVRSGANRDTDSAVLFSGQLGYGAMFAQSTYLGVKGSVFYTPLKDTDNYSYSSSGVPALLINGVDSFTRSVKPIYNVDLVLGYEIMPRVLPFVEGGVSFANVKHNFTALGTVSSLTPNIVSEYAGSNVLDTYKTGYNVGIGANYLPARNWVLSTELVYNHLGKRDITLTNVALPAGTSATHFRNESNQAVSLLFSASYLFG